MHTAQSAENIIAKHILHARSTTADFPFMSLEAALCKYVVVPYKYNIKIQGIIIHLIRVLT